MEKYVFLNLWTMRVIGVWFPDKSSPFELKVYIFMRTLTVASILFIVIPAAIGAHDNLRQNNISSGVEVLALLISAIVVFCKILNIVLRRSQVRILLDRMSDFWLEATAEEVKVMTGFAEIGRNLTKWYLALGFFSIISFVGQPFLNSYIFYNAENSSAIIVNRMPFDGWENFMVDSQSTSIFVLVYSSHVLTGMLASAASIGHDSLFVVLILHVCANLRAVTTSLKKFEFIEKDNKIEENVIRCAKTFRNLIEYTKELEDMLSLYLLAQSVSSTLIICLTSFLVSRDIQANKELFKYVSFWSAALFQIFIFCWAANYLQTEANMVGRSAYNAYGKLMNLDLKNRRNREDLLKKIPRYLQLILLRSQAPLEITAGNFYAMSLENFKKILSTSYSYFTILRALADTKT